MLLLISEREERAPSRASLFSLCMAPVRKKSRANASKHRVMRASESKKDTKLPCTFSSFASSVFFILSSFSSLTCACSLLTSSA